MSSNEDHNRIQHMLDSANEVVSFTEAHQRSDLDDNLMLLRALSMSIGIIGEAAVRVSDEKRNEYDSIPWRQIIGMRNFLFHEYFKVDTDILWDTATKAVPSLIPQLTKILGKE